MPCCNRSIQGMPCLIESNQGLARFDIMLGESSDPGEKSANQATSRLRWGGRRADHQREEDG